jgi:CBS domain-containing protein
MGDFTTTIRVLPISGLALAIGVIAAFVALALLQLVGVRTRGDIRERLERDGQPALERALGELVRSETVETYPDETLRVIVYRMAELGLTRMPVVERATRKFLGLVSLDDLLKARARHLEEERRRERPLKLRFLLPGGRVTEETQPSVAH